MKVASCQPPYVHCDIPHALGAMLRFASEAETAGADLVCFPECYLQGYLFDEGEATHLAVGLQSETFAGVLDRLAHLNSTLVFGLIEQDGEDLFNTAVVVRKGRLLGVYRKMNLVSGERVFAKGRRYPVFEAAGVKFGINICYDLSFPDSARAVAEQGAKLLLCPCNNMMGKEAAVQWEPKHNSIRGNRAAETGMWLISSDVTGEWGQRMALGPTAVIAPNGVVVGQVPRLTEGLIYQEIQAGQGRTATRPGTPLRRHKPAN